MRTVLCGKCGGEINYGLKTPHDWDECKRLQFEVVKRHGKPYSEPNESGYIYKGERWRTWLRGPTVTGERYSRDRCDCGLPPWEICKEDCTAQI